MNEDKHSQEVINYCIDNHLTFAEGYVQLIEQKLNSVDEGLHDLRKDVEFSIEDAHCS